MYRSAQVTLLTEMAPECADKENELRRRIGEHINRWFAEESASLAQLRKLLQSGLPLGSLCDVISFALPLDSCVKQTLLEEIRMEQRALLLLKHLEGPGNKAAATSSRPFPPEFSCN
jgi:hypothetical protein